jgi:hypothetical protein
MIRSTATALALGGATLAAGPTAQAGVFDAASGGALSVTDVRYSGSDVGLSISVLDEYLDELSSGGGSALADLSYDIADPTGFAVSAQTSADGTNNAGGVADAVVLFEFLNGTDGDVEIDFSYNYDIEASAERDQRTFSDATADALFNFFLDGVVIDGAGFEDVSVYADATFGPTLDELDGSGEFTVLLPVGESAELDIVSSAFGNSVPVPPALALMGLGLGLLAGVGRTRRA